MKEIEVNEYVRTKDGIIDKVIIEYDGKCNNSNCNEKHISCKYNYYNEKEIVRHSKELIDLIEVGDFVNGRLVLQVDYKNKNVCLLIPFADTKANTNIMWYGYEQIKTILTKEQMEANQYVVK